MSFVRRGSVTFPHKEKAFVLYHRLDGSVNTIRLSDINCWEEHQAEQFGPVCMLYYGLSNCALRESFDEFTKLVDEHRPAVSHA